MPKPGPLGSLQACPAMAEASGKTGWVAGEEENRVIQYAQAQLLGILLTDFQDEIEVTRRRLL